MAEKGWVGAYTRKSRALGDLDDPHLMAVHMDTLERLAASDGIPLAAGSILMEVGSGELIEERLVFSALIAEIERLPPSIGGTLYCMDLARLSRGDLGERGRIFRALARARVLVRTPARIYDPNNPDDELMYSVMSSVDRHELGKYLQRVAYTRDKKTREGQSVNGKVAWGYRWMKSPGQADKHRLPGRIEADPVKFPRLVACCQEVEVDSLLQLSERYAIHPSIVHGALTNPMICGYPARRHERTHDDTLPAWKKYYRRPAERWLWPDKPGDYPAACTREEWDQIQQILHSRAVQRGRPDDVDTGWCKDVVRFDGWPGLCKRTSRWSSGRQYLCYSLPRPGPPTLPDLYVDREVVEDTAVKALRILIASPSMLMRYYQEFHERQRHQRLKEVDIFSREEIVRLIGKERGRLTKLMLDAADPDHSPEMERALLEAKRETEDRIDSLRNSLQQLDNPIPPPTDLPRLMPASEFSESFDQAWGKLSGTRKRLLLNACLEAIPVRVMKVNPRPLYHREVLPVHYRPWAASYLGLSVPNE